MNRDIIYAILLWADVLTLKVFNITHKQTFSKLFWVTKYTLENLPSEDYDLKSYEKLVKAKLKTYYLYEYEPISAFGI